MGEPSFKRRSREAKVSAMEDYRERGYLITPCTNDVVCFSARDMALTHECLVRVVVGEISKQDIELIMAYPILHNQRKEIMCRPFNGRKWIRRVYDPGNRLCQ